MTTPLHWKHRPSDDPRESEPPDWVIAHRLVRGKAPGRNPTEAEIRLAVWFLLDQGRTVQEITEDTALSENAVTRIYDLRRLATKKDRPRGPKGARNPQDARALAPHWYHVMLLAGAYARARRVALNAGPVSELVGAGTG